MATLGIPQNTIEVLQKYNFNFQKKFGQNFLIDENVVEKIVREAGVTKDDFVLEVGPGIGTMTQILCENAREVVAVEIDKKLIPILTEDTLSWYDNVTVINEDILKLNIKELADKKNGGKPIKVVANLPYYITTQYYARPKIVLNVPASCFMPRPNVDSAVIKLERYQKPPVDVLDEHLMFKIIRASFNQRRKTMMNSVGNSGEVNVSKEELLKALEQCGFSATIRGEALTLEQFAALTNAIINNR